MVFQAPKEMFSLPLALGITSLILGVAGVIGAFIIKKKSTFGFWALIIVGVLFILFGLLGIATYFLQRKQLNFAKEHPELLRLALL